MEKEVKETTIPKIPVVVVLGHVDHGKTTLLDTIRKSRITASEHGQITQRIGAYHIDHDGKQITFIDTPGHEAFNNLRSRGSTIADIAVLVIDANESIKPQTIESIKLIQSAHIPFIIALNKVDLPTANVAKVKQDLLRYSVIVEEKGGNIACVPISAKTGTGVSDLLDTIVLLSQIKHISVTSQASFSGVIIEVTKTSGRGCCATVLVTKGALHGGDEIQTQNGEQVRVRAIFDDRGIIVKEAFPGMAVEMLGFTKLPTLGEMVYGKDFHIETVKKEVDKAKENDSTDNSLLWLYIKADTQGSLEALLQSIPKESSVIRSGIGDITESDIETAKTTKTVIIGFNVRATSKVMKYAQDEHVRIRLYTLIYKLLEELAEVIDILKKGPQKKILGEGKVLKIFDLPSGKILGCQITDGRLARGDKIQLVRKGDIVQDSLIVTSLRQEKEEIKKVEKGDMCGVSIKPFVDFEAGDMIQSYILYEF